MIYIQMVKATDLTAVRLIDMQGRVLRDIPSYNEKLLIELNINELENGVYLLILESDAYLYSRRIVKY